MQCPNCLLDCPEGSRFCPKCGLRLEPIGAPPPLRQRPDSGGPPPKKGWATAALVCAVFSVLSLGLLFPVGVVVGLVAVVKTRRSPETHGGETMAVAGLITSAVSIAMLILAGVIAAIAIPNFIAARRAATEATVVTALRHVVSGCEEYAATEGQYPESLEDLVQGRLVNPGLIAPEQGYTYRYERRARPEDAGYTVIAAPDTSRSGLNRWFYVDETGVIRRSDSADVGPQSPPSPGYGY
jgi:type IV pilus assembly protein PilA